MLIPSAEAAQILVGWEKKPLFVGSPFLNGLSENPFSCLEDCAALLVIMDDNRILETTAGKFKESLDGKHQDVRAIYKRPTDPIINEPIVKKRFVR